MTISGKRTRQDCGGEAGGSCDGLLARRGAWVFAERLVRELRSLEAAGAPLPEGMRQFAARCRGAWKRGVLAAADRMEAGADPADALAGARLLPPEVAAMIRAGTAGGTMTRCLDAAADYLRSRRQALRALSVALYYPAFVLTVAAVVTGVVTFGAMPALTGTMEQLRGETGAPLPPLAAASIRVQQALAGVTWMLWLACGAAAFVCVCLPGSTAAARLLSWVPLYRRYVGMRSCHHFAAATGAMLRAGMPLAEALRVLRDGAKQPELRRLPEAGLAGLERGMPLSEGVERAGLLSQAELAFLRAAEQQEDLENYFRAMEQRSLDGLHCLRDIAAGVGVPAVVCLAVLVALYVLAVAVPVFGMRFWVPA